MLQFHNKLLSFFLFYYVLIKDSCLTRRPFILVNSQLPLHAIYAQFFFYFCMLYVHWCEISINPKRDLKLRLAEHQSTIKNQAPENSALSDYSII